MASPTPADVITESAASMATMEAEVQALLDASAAARQASISGRASATPQAAPPDDPAGTPAKGSSGGTQPTTARPSGKTTDATPAGASQAPSSSKIPGPDSLAAKPTSAEPGGKADTAASTAPPASPDFSDIPREYVVGKVNSKNWSRLHEKIDHYEREAQAARAEAEALKQKASTATPSPELEARLTALQAERDSILSRLEAVAVERSPRFEAAFKPRIDAAHQTARAAVGPERADRVGKLLELPESAFRDEQIEAVIQDIGPQTLRAQKLLQSVAELDRITAERQGLAAQGSQLYKQWQQEEQQATQRQQAERLSTITSTFDKTVADWQKAGANLDDAGIALARDVFMGKRNVEEVATAAMWVAVGPRAAATALKLQTRVAELEAQLAKFTSAQPGTASDAGSSPNGEPAPEVPSTSSYADAITQMVQSAGLLKR